MSDGYERLPVVHTGVEPPATRRRRLFLRIGRRGAGPLRQAAVATARTPATAASPAAALPITLLLAMTPQ